MFIDIVYICLLMIFTFIIALYIFTLFTTFYWNRWTLIYLEINEELIKKYNVVMKTAAADESNYWINNLL